jgi:hypothetical protein
MTTPPGTHLDDTQAAAVPASESLTPAALRDAVIRSPLAPERVLDAFRAASRKGNLAGFRTSPPASPAAGALGCICDVFGAPFDRELRITIAPAASGGSELRFDTKLRPGFPLAAVVMMALALWPGVWLTDSLLVTYFSWYPRAAWFTPAWYLPLMLLCVPVLIKQCRRSEAAAAAHTGEVLDKLARLAQGSRA